MTRGRKMALSVAVVIAAVVVGYVVGAFAIALVPGAPLQGGAVEATPAHLVVFMATFAVVGVGSLMGVVYVWRKID